MMESASTYSSLTPRFDAEPVFPLLSSPNRGKSHFMVKCYVGTISRRGLESLFPETEHAMPFLTRRAYRRRPTESVCYWAVLPDTVARDVQRQLQWQHHEEALATLYGQAAYFGTIPPSASEDAG